MTTHKTPAVEEFPEATTSPIASACYAGESDSATKLADLLNVALPPAWVLDGVCAQTDPDAWYWERNDPTSAERQIHARRICRTSCPVQRDCLLWALAHEEPYGIWGGTSAVQRRRMMRAYRRGQSVHDPLTGDRLNDEIDIERNAIAAERGEPAPRPMRDAS